MIQTFRDENYHTRREAEKHAAQIEIIDKEVDLARAELKEIESQAILEKKQFEQFEKSTNETHKRIVSKQVALLFNSGTQKEAHGQAEP